MAPRKKIPVLPPMRGVASAAEAQDWLKLRGIEEIECVVADQAGVALGKIMPVSKFFAGTRMALPASVFIQTITGDYPEEHVLSNDDYVDNDLFFQADFSTLTTVPWAHDPTAQMIHDPYHADGRPVEYSPRNVLKRVVSLYRARGWTPIVAPEIEFYLVKPNTDPDLPLEPPIGRSGRPEAGRRSFSIAAVNEFDALFEDIYDYAEAQGLEIDTLIHEGGAAQMEINLRHGEPLSLADQVFLFKRTIREAALQHNIYATFMAKPIAAEPGSAMHIHQSVVDAQGRNIFSDENGRATQAFFSFIAGQQRYLPRVLVMLAPYVNSFRRLVGSSAPTNVSWGYDNRTTGLRVPSSDSVARRVENRLPSSDANPYLAIAASLAAGYLGLIQGLTPSDPVTGSALDLEENQIPSGLLEAVAEFEDDEDLQEVLGKTFVKAYAAIKRAEFKTFMRVISPWEREFLLLNV